MDQTIPARMRHIGLDQPGGPDVLHLVDGPVPRPGPGEVLIEVAAAGVNRPDLLQRAGNYAPPPGASPILGLEVAGTVVAIGEPEGEREGGASGTGGIGVGDRVAALVNGGGYAEYCVAPRGQCLPFPDGHDAVASASLPENLFTVWANVFAPREQGGAALRPGETLLVHGGTSGIGLAAIRLAHAFGARVIATAGSAEKCAACRSHGADAAIDYKREDFAQAVATLTDGRGCDVILDIVGAAYLARNVASLAMDGRLAIIGVTGGATARDFALWPLISRRGSITGTLLRPRTAAEKAVIAASLRAHVWPLLSAGRIRPVIEAVLPLADAGRAHARLDEGTHVGKIVLAVR